MKRNIIFAAVMSLFMCFDLCARVTMYVIFTPSHERYFEEWFKPSLLDDYELVVQKIEQKCKQASFMQRGWKETVIQKVDLIIQAVKDNWNKVFLFSDVDIRFYRKTWEHIEPLIERHDIVIQKDAPSGTRCTGFFACRGNARTLAFWQKVRAYLANRMNSKESVGDQRSFNMVLRKNPRMIHCGFLPNSFMSGGTFTSKQWRPGHKLPVPKDIVLHHANWTSGEVNKIKQLEYVQDVVARRQKDTKN